jgi:hypothetical protein
MNMGLKAFGGDATHRLPKPKMEPYRLWFEFLKLALRDPTITVKPDFYADWGDVAGSNFDQWWGSNWRRLFAEPAPTHRLTTALEFRDAISDPDSIVVRISLTETHSQRMEEIKSAVAAAGEARKPRTGGKAPFSLTANRSMNLSSLRVFQRFYRFWLESNGDLEATCRSYYAWAKAWNDQVKGKGWKRNQLAIPPYLPTYIDHLDLKAAGKAKATDGDAMRADMRRYVRRAKKIVQNVAKGVFPGDY